MENGNGCIFLCYRNSFYACVIKAIIRNTIVQSEQLKPNKKGDPNRCQTLARCHLTRMPSESLTSIANHTSNSLSADLCPIFLIYDPAMDINHCDDIDMRAFQEFLVLPPNKPQEFDLTSNHHKEFYQGFFKVSPKNTHLLLVVLFETLFWIFMSKFKNKTKVLGLK